MNIESPNKMRTRQSLPVNGCDCGGGVGISSWEGILSRGSGRLQFKCVDCSAALYRNFLEARLLIARDLLLMLNCPPLPEWYAAHKTDISTNYGVLGCVVGLDSRWHGFVYLCVGVESSAMGSFAQVG